MTRELTHNCSIIDAALGRRGAGCVNSGPKGPVKLTQQPPLPPNMAGTTPGIDAGIDAPCPAAGAAP